MAFNNYPGSKIRTIRGMTMQDLHNLSRRGGCLIRVAAAAAGMLLTGSHGYANILSTSATLRPNNSLLVDVQVTTGANVERVSITYQTTGVGRPFLDVLAPGRSSIHRFSHVSVRLWFPAA